MGTNISTKLMILCTPGNDSAELVALNESLQDLLDGIQVKFTDFSVIFCKFLHLCFSKIILGPKKSP